MAKKERGIVYIATTPAEPGRLKMGCTTDIARTLRQISKSVSQPYKSSYELEVEDMNKVVLLLRDAFHHFRIPKEEIYEIAPDKVASALKLVLHKGITPKKKATSQQQPPEIQEPFTFSEAGVPINAMITFIHKDENGNTIEAEVFTETRIIFDGEVTLMSIVAEKLLNAKEILDGPKYWKYKDEIIEERWERIQNK